MDDDSSSSKLQLCLTWNNFTDNIINSLESSYGDGDFVDVTLACEGESIKAHKLVLSACSHYLKRLLKENPCPHPIIILKDVGLSELKDLLVYMYHGEVRVEQDRIAKLLHTAQILEVRGLRDISQKLDQDLENGQAHDSSSVNDAAPNQDAEDSEYNSSKTNGPNNNSLSLHGKSVTLTTKTGTVGETSSLKPPPMKKSRPVPMLQCIQQSGKADCSMSSALHDDRNENESGEDESNNSSVAPEHTIYPEEVKIKEESPDIAEDFGSFVPNQSSTHDESCSDAERQQFNNGYTVSPTVIPINSGGTIGGGFLAAEMLKRVATRASSNESVSAVREALSISSSGLNSSIPEQEEFLIGNKSLDNVKRLILRAGSISRTQEESSDEVIVSLLKSRKRSSSISSAIPDANKQNESLNFRSWGMMNFSRTVENRHTIDLTTDKSHENMVEIMDVEALPFSRKTTFRDEQQNYVNSRHAEDMEFIRPEYMLKEETGSLRYLDIESTLNINPQLRLQMLMCREYKKYTNILLVAMFGREMLATHSLNGTGTSKPRLDTRKVNHIIEAVMTKFGVDQHHVKEAIRIKLNNEDKLKKRLTQKVTSTVVGLQ